MTEETVILCSQDRVDQVFGSVLNPDGNSSLISEFTHEPAVDAVYPKRLFQPDVLHHARRGEIGPDHGNHRDEGGRDPANGKRK